MTTIRTDFAPIVKIALVPQAPPDALRIFTEEMANWWPLSSHSVGEDRARTVRFGASVGEQIVEVFGKDEESIWGTITAWEPPDRVAFNWHPGNPPTEATAVEVTFVADGNGTRVTLTHTGWENWPDSAQAHAGYDTGWDFVLGQFRTYAGG